MKDAQGGVEWDSPARKYRVGTAPFLIARPIVHGLDKSERIELVRGAPSRMKGLLANGELDAAFLPSSDLPCLGPKVTVLPAGCAASSGTTLGAKIFSQVKPERIAVLWVDSGSSSTIMLVRLLWMVQYQRHIRTVPFNATREQAPHDVDAVLVIGDRVVAGCPIGFDWQFDPAGMWYEMTALPFVFAIWATLHESGCPELYRLLREAREAGERHLEEIAAEYAPGHGWPTDLATRCLTSEIQFNFTDAHREGLEEFLQMAAEYGLIDSPTALRYYRP